MKIKLKATASAPAYDINGESINGFDLSVIEQGGKFVGNEDTREAGIRDAYRDESGELHVVLKQAPPVTKISYIVNGKPVTLKPDAEPPEGYSKAVEHRGGNWTESDWIDAADYDPGTLYIKKVTP